MLNKPAWQRISFFFPLLLAACSNSEYMDYSVNDEFKNQVENEHQSNNEHNTDKDDKQSQVTVPQKSLPIELGKLIPNAKFTTPFTIQSPQALHNGVVRCTFDGSAPSTKSQIISEDKIIDKTTVVRCTEFLGENAILKQTETYFVNESIHMPVISISTDPYYVSEYLDVPPCKPDPCKEAKFWEDVEYPVHVEFFADGSSSNEKGFEINAGISITGNWSRNQQKKSIAIIMRKEYQNGRLHYPLFNTRQEKNIFKAFLLRNNGQRFVSDYIGDAVATSLLEGTNVDYQRSKQVIVFYNGQYRGIYDMREKVNEHFFETNYGIDPNTVNLIKHNATTISVQNGNSSDYLRMLQFIFQNNFEENDAAYDSVLKMMDIVNYMEYMAAEIYFQNGDWPHTNVRVWKENYKPWKFILFDVDQGLDWAWDKNLSPEQKNMFYRIASGGDKNGECFKSTNYKCFHNIFKKLCQNSTFKQKFINRAVYLYSTFINYDSFAKAIENVNSSIEDNQINRDLALYNRPKRNNFCNTSFEPYGDCLKQWSEKRDKSVRTEIREFFNLGKDVTIDIEIKGNGRLKLDNMEIEQEKIYKWIVFEKNPIQISIECPTGKSFVSWNDSTKESSRIIMPKEDSRYIAYCD